MSLAFLLVVVFGLSTWAYGQTPPSPTSFPLYARYGFAEEDLGYLLFDLSDGKALEAHQPDEPRIPASTTKIVTTVAALQILGAEHRFNTTLLMTGDIRDGTLSGAVYLRGGGDPTLSTDDLRKLILALQQVGIKRVIGSFLFDDSLLPTTRDIDPKQPLAVSYNPGLSALSVNYNRIFLRWRHKPGAAAFNASLLSSADGGPVPVKDITIGGLPSGLDRRIKFVPDGSALDRWLLSPALPARGVIDLPVRNNPGRLTALLFRTLCQQRKITLPPPQAGAVPPNARALHALQSAPLAEIVTQLLRYSNNLSAELVGLAATRTLTGNAPQLTDSASALSDWYRQTLPRTTWQGFRSLNHSGLSSATRHTPRQLADILRYAWNHRFGGERFADLLSPPHWGKEAGAIRERIKAKSGTMSYADGLVGYLTTTQGRQLGFVVLLTDFSRRAALDANFDVRIADTPPEARAWTDRAKAFEQSLVTRWVMQY
jgi:D-alanyl-D-alanine carboxypeptidase/D-alanyl-D-alanine-endopeptidase (penicillin-binding protein 4)